MANTIQQERRKAIQEMALVSSAVNTMLGGTYRYQIPFGSIHDLSTADMHRINKEWLKKIKPKKRMTKKEYRRWKSKMKRLGVA